MRISQLFVVALLCASAVFVSCNKDKDDDPAPCGVNFSFYAELSDEANQLQIAAEAYGMDQSQANCQAYVGAWNDYLDAARDLENCAIQAGQQADYNQAIDEAQTAIDQFQC